MMNIFSLFSLYAILFAIVWIYSFVKVVVSEFEGSNTKIIWVLALIFLPLTAFLFVFIGRKQIVNDEFNVISFFIKIMFYIFVLFLIGYLSVILKNVLTNYFPNIEFGFFKMMLISFVLVFSIIILIYLIRIIINYISPKISKATYFSRLKKEAQNGNSQAQNRLAVRYHDGNGVKKDINKAVYWYKKAAENNSTWAKYNLAELYFKDEFFQKDYNQALNLYKEATKDNHKESFNRLGQIYEYGYGVDRDYKKAFIFYEKSAKLRYPSGLYNLALCYKDGIGIEKDMVKYRLNLLEAIKLKHDKSMVELGIYYRDKDDIEQSLEYFEEATNFNNSNAFLQIGYMYYYGNKLISINYDIAFKYFEKAANLNNSKAKAFLADVILKYTKIKDYDRAKRLLNEAANDNIKEAINLKKEFNI